MVEVRLFGPGNVKNGELTLDGFPNQQYHLVLCYLIINRHQPHRREKLAATFWTDYPTATSRKYLRDALWRLRHALDAIRFPLDRLLAITDEQVALRLSNDCWLDVAQFETALQNLKSTPPPLLDEQMVEQAEQAVRLYTGDLLDGLYQEWCLYERERLRLLYLSALGKLMEHHEAHANFDKAVTYGECILKCDGTRETVHRQMMRLYALMGNRDGAIRQYRSCTLILQDTFGMPPLEETTHLYTQILTNQVTPAALAKPSCVVMGDADPRSDNLLNTQYVLQRVRRINVLLEETRAELTELENILGVRRAVREDGNAS